MKTDILGIRFDNLTREEARQAGAQLLQSPDFHYVVTPNPEFILAAEKDLEFQKILNKADLVLPDGIGVVYSSKILGTPLKERVAGFDFACDMLEELDKLGGRLYLLGSKPGVAETAAENISQAHPNIVICGTHDGYFKDSDPVAREVAAAQPDLLFVCLGAPKQEIFMSRLKPFLDKGVMIAVGAAFKFYSGIEARRAPDWMVKMHLEFVYRIFCEPKKQLRRCWGIISTLPRLLIEEKRRAGQRQRTDR